MTYRPDAVDARMETWINQLQIIENVIVKEVLKAGIAAYVQKAQFKDSIHKYYIQWCNRIPQWCPPRLQWNVYKKRTRLLRVLEKRWRHEYVPQPVKRPLEGIQKLKVSPCEDQRSHHGAPVVRKRPPGKGMREISPVDCISSSEDGPKPMRNKQQSSIGKVVAQV